MKYLSFWHLKLMFSQGKEAGFVCGSAAILYCFSLCKQKWLGKLHEVGFFILLGFFLPLVNWTLQQMTLL